MRRIKLKIGELKTTLLVNTEAQTIIDVHVTATRKHHTHIDPKVTKRSRKHSALVADKGYEDRLLRLQLRHYGKLRVTPHYELKPHDAANNARIKNKIYRRRNLVETVISVLKCKHPAAITSWIWWHELPELASRCLVHK